MPQKKSETIFLVSLILGTIILSFYVFKPFISAIILAMVFVTIFAPVHRVILKISRNKQGLAAFISTIIVLVIAVMPLIFVGINIFYEATGMYSSITDESNTTNISQYAEKTINQVRDITSLPLNFSVDLNQYLKQGLTWLLQHLGPVFSNIASLLISSFIFLVALYYTFKDGQKFKAYLITLSPLHDTHDETIAKKLIVAVNSVIRGTLVVAVIQGILTSVGFAIFGVPNPTLWGSTAAIAALIPGVGTALVLTPAIIYLFLSGQFLASLGMLIWSVMAVGLVDNFLGPKFMEKGVNIHPFIILLSILGGIAFFGPLGFILGPLMVSLLFALMEIYLSIKKEHE
ncbi:MAG: AI-2E family transporter [bacterium]|nr:AI-2E family transporter [bacterium]